MGIFMFSARVNNLIHLQLNTEYRLQKLTKKLMDVQQYASMVGKGSVSIGDLLNAPSSMMGRTLGYLSWAHNNSLQYMQQNAPYMQQMYAQQMQQQNQQQQMQMQTGLYDLYSIFYQLFSCKVSLIHEYVCIYEHMCEYTYVLTFGWRSQDSSLEPVYPSTTNHRIELRLSDHQAVSPAFTGIFSLLAAYSVPLNSRQMQMFHGNN